MKKKLIKTLFEHDLDVNSKLDTSKDNVVIFTRDKNDSNSIWASGVIEGFGNNPIFTNMSIESYNQWSKMLDPKKDKIVISEEIGESILKRVGTEDRIQAREEILKAATEGLFQVMVIEPFDDNDSITEFLSK